MEEVTQNYRQCNAEDKEEIGWDAQKEQQTEGQAWLLSEKRSIQMVKNLIFKPPPTRRGEGKNSTRADVVLKSIVWTLKRYCVESISSRLDENLSSRNFEKD